MWYHVPCTTSIIVCIPFFLQPVDQKPSTPTAVSSSRFYILYKARYIQKLCGNKITTTQPVETHCIIQKNAGKRVGNAMPSCWMRQAQHAPASNSRHWKREKRKTKLEKTQKKRRKKTSVVPLRRRCDRQCKTYYVNLHMFFGSQTYRYCSPIGLVWYLQI